MIEITEQNILAAIIFSLWFEHIWESYLSIRQYKLASRTTRIPSALENVMSKETFDKARLYSIDKFKFGFIKGMLSIVVSTLIIYYGMFAKLWYLSERWNFYEGEVAVSCIWMFIITLVQTVMDIPFNVYYTFVLEEKYGFNKQTARFFVVDKIKGFILSIVLTLPISSVAIVIVKYGGDYFFLWLWLATGLITLILLTIYPSYIAPRFDKYTPLPEGELRTEIEALASTLKFPLAQLYVVEGSKRSSHSNAYFYGLFKTKRIVLFDTLLENSDGGCQNDEVLAVLSHELGHWHHGHITKNLIIMQVNLFLMFAVFALTFKYPLIYQAIGFRAGLRPILVGLIVVLQFILMPYNTILSFLMTCLSRRFEFQADAFAMHLRKAEPLRRALIKLNKDNLGFPVYDALYSAWYHSHPPLLERLSALDKQD